MPDLKKWYRILELVCQLGALAVFGVRVWFVLPKASMGLGELMQLLPLPAMFIMFSMLFRYLGADDPQPVAGQTDNKSHLIVVITGIMQSVGIEGMHFVALMSLVGVYILFLIFRDPEVKEVAIGLFGFFMGLEAEKRAPKRH